MAESDSGEKTEEATPQRREDFRKKGQVAQTRELSAVLTLLGTALIMWMLGRFLLEQLHLLFSVSVGEFIVLAARKGEYAAACMYVFQRAALILGPIFGLAVLFSLSSSIVQIGFLVNEEALQFKVDRLDPIAGLKRIFSMRAIIEGAKSVAKVILIGVLVYIVMRSEFTMVPKLIYLSIPELMVYIGEIFLKMIALVGFFMAALAGADFLFQKWDLEQKMKMSKQEVKEETKSREGDPLIKARIRRVQREMATKRMMEDVPTADVIVTNPTHIAVALKYDGATMASPQIVAMGADVIAEKIKELARKHNVPVVENKPLARTIYKTLKVGQSVPRELFKAVAEVLSYVYKLKRKVVR